MKMILTLIALVALTTACTKEDVVGVPAVELATVEDTCIVADDLVGIFVIYREYHALQDLRTTLGDEGPFEVPLSKEFWEPLLMRVYAEPNIGAAPRSKYGNVLAEFDRDDRVREFKSMLTLECYEAGVQLPQQFVADHNQVKVDREQAKVEKQQQENQQETNE